MGSDSFVVVVVVVVVVVCVFCFHWLRHPQKAQSGIKTIMWHKQNPRRRGNLSYPRFKVYIFCFVCFLLIFFLE